MLTATNHIELCEIERNARKLATATQRYPTSVEFTAAGNACTVLITAGTGRMMGGLMAVYYMNGKRTSFAKVSALVK